MYALHLEHVNILVPIYFMIALIGADLESMNIYVCLITHNFYETIHYSNLIHIFSLLLL